MCASPAHDRENLGLDGRREVVAQVLAAAGIEAQDADRLAADRTLPDGDASKHVGRLRPRRHHLRRRHRRIPTPDPDLAKPVRARQDPRRATRLTTCGQSFGNTTKRRNRCGLNRRDEDMETHELMTTEEVAEHFRVNASTVRRWRLDGVGPRFVKIGSVYRYPRASLSEWIAQRIGGRLVS